MKVMLVPSSSEATPSRALDSCSRWGYFLRSPGNRAMGLAACSVKMWLVDREWTGIPGYTQPHSELCSSLVFWILSRLSVP